MKVIAALWLVLAATAHPEIDRIASRVDAAVGVAAIDLDTGRTISVRGDEAFPMASVFKFPLAVEVLRRVDAKQLSLATKYTIPPAEFSPGHSPIRDNAHGQAVTMTLRDLVTSAVAESDNTAGDYLLRLVTPRSVSDTMKRLHAGGIRVDRTEREIIETYRGGDGWTRYATDPRDTATPLAAAALAGMLQRNREGLTPESHKLLVEVLGVRSHNPVRVARLLPAGASVLHKTGTMPGTMNDVALVTSADGKHHVAIAIFTKAAKKSTEADRESVIAEIARAVYAALTK